MSEAQNTSSPQPSGELSADELAEQQIVDLPNREAMSLIQPGLGLIEGNLVSPTDQPITGPAPTDTQPTTTQPTTDSSQLLGSPEPQPAPAPLPPQPAPASDQPYSPTASDSATS